MNLAALPVQRLVPRPPSAAEPMPAELRVGRIALPDDRHAGTPLAKLADPYEPGSRGAARDWAFTRSLLAQRMHAGDAWARVMDHKGGSAIWRELAEHVPGEQSAVQALVGAALSAASTHAGVGKKRWMRQRPFQADPSIKVIGRAPKGADSSYPSGHTARAYAAARVVARLDPSLADQAYDLAREVALSRVYAGVHFASDVVAGARLGISLAESVLARRDSIVGATIAAA